LKVGNFGARRCPLVKFDPSPFSGELDTLDNIDLFHRKSLKEKGMKKEKERREKGRFLQGGKDGTQNF